MSKNYGFGILAGLATGVAIGVLCAPGRGRLGSLVSGQARKSVEGIKSYTHNMMDSASDMVEKGKDHLARQQEEIKKAVDVGKKAFQEAADSQIAAA